MPTNLVSFASPAFADLVIRLTGTVVLFVIIPVIAMIALTLAIRRSRKNASGVHPIGHTMRPAELPSGKERILVVDDEPIALQIHTEMLKELGYTCHTAKSGEAAVEFFRSGSADLVLLDLIMDPGINGVETLRRIKAIAPNTKAILLSGYAKPSDVAAAQAMGAGAYLIKPVSFGMLANEVRRELDAHHKKSK
jgi:CheY-like chemotaxis protein